MIINDKHVNIRLSFLAKAILLALSSTFVIPAVSYAATACNTSDGVNGSTPIGGNCTLPAYDPTINDNKKGAAFVDGGDSLTLTGNINIALGDIGSSGLISIEDLTGLTLIDAPSGSTIDTEKRLVRGARDKAIEVEDPIIGGPTTILTFDSDNFQEQSISEYLKVENKQPVNGQQYIDARLGTAADSGKLNIDIGDNTKSRVLGS